VTRLGGSLSLSLYSLQRNTHSTVSYERVRATYLALRDLYVNEEHVVKAGTFQLKNSAWFKTSFILLQTTLWNTGKFGVDCSYEAANAKITQRS
jgi:hypothetical protein